MKKVMAIVAILLGTAALLFLANRSIAHASATPSITGIAGIVLALTCGKTIFETLIKSRRVLGKRMLVRTARFARHLRRLNSPAPETNFLTAVSIAILAITWSRGIFSVADSPLTSSTYVALGIACVAGIYDATHRARKLAQWAWGRIVGKLFIACVIVLAGIAADSVSAHIVYVMTGTDLTTHGRFAKVAAALAWPVLFVAVLALLVIIATLVEVISVMFGVLVLNFAQRFGLSEKVRNRILLGSVAVKQGARPSIGSSIFYAVRSLGKIGACVAFIAAVQVVINDPWPAVGRQATDLMALLDYEKGLTCMPADVRYGMRLDDKTRSVMTRVDDHIEKVEIINCDDQRRIFNGNANPSP